MIALALAAALAQAPTVSSPSAAMETPPQGMPLEVRRGFFTETDIGAFFTLGGDNRYSNAQTYLQLGVGYDLTDRLELGVHFGLGSNAYNCFTGRGGTCLSDSFTLAFGEGTLAYRFELAERLYLAPKVAAGYASLDPAPVRLANGRVVKNAPLGGVGVGIEYATPMDHFSVGLDGLFRYVIGPNIPAIAIYPRVKYTF
jgi:hypothetical protein